jgi:hypothetical protein
MAVERFAKTSPRQFDSYVELLSFLSSLPPPPEGKMRVYRGQPTDHGLMLPSGYRTTHQPWKARLWKSYAHFVAEYLWRQIQEQGFGSVCLQCTRRKLPKTMIGGFQLRVRTAVLLWPVNRRSRSRFQSEVVCRFWLHSGLNLTWPIYRRGRSSLQSGIAGGV